MKFNSKKVRDIVYLDDDFVDIVGIDNYGRFVYEFGIWADITKAIKNNSYVVKVSAYSSNPITSINLFDDARNSREVIDSLKNYDSKLKSAVRSARANPLAVKSVDISSGINNSTAKKIKDDPDNADKHLGLQRQILAIPAVNISGEDADSAPNLNVAKVEPAPSTDRSLRRAAIKSIMSGIDPSAIGEASFPINNYWSSIQGIDRKFSNLSTFQQSRVKKTDLEWQYGNRRELTQSQSNTSVKSNMWSKYLRTSLRSGPSSNNETESLALVSSKTKVISRLSTNNFTHIKEKIRIPSKSIGGIRSIHFIIELYNSKGDIIDVKHRVVNHDVEVEEFLTPDYAPRIRAIATNVGKNTVWIRQVDKIATEVWLYRKILRPSAPSLSSEYQLIRKIPLTSKDLYFRIVDSVNNTTQCIYRAVAVGPKSRLSSTFRNAVAEPYRHALLNKKTVKELTHISIFAQSQGNNVAVRVSNIPEGPVALYVTADNLTMKPSVRKFNDSIRVVGSEPEEQSRVINSDTNELTFIDVAVQHGHIYEYRAVMVYPNGAEVKSQITEVYEFLKESTAEAKIVINLTGLTIQSDDSGNSTVTFNIEPSFTDLGLETIIESLEAAGAEKNFISEIQSDRSRLNNLLAFLVQRQDSKSGETETFGVISSPQFTDDLTSRRASGVRPIRAGSRYRYIVKVLLRSAESMFGSSTSENVDLETVKKFNKKIAKFMNPSTLMNGTLPSTGQSFAANFTSGLNHEDKFLQGRTGVESGIDVEIPSLNPEIDSIVAQRAGDKKVLIYWTITGNYEEIEHFIVMAEIHGVKSTVATVHNMSNNGRYHYYDREVAGEIGTVKYSVIPVLSDYTYGTEVFAKETTLESDVPKFMTEL